MILLVAFAFVAILATGSLVGAAALAAPRDPIDELVRAERKGARFPECPYCDPSRRIRCSRHFYGATR